MAKIGKSAHKPAASRASHSSKASKASKSAAKKPAKKPETTRAAKPRDEMAQRPARGLNDFAPTNLPNAAPVPQREVHHDNPGPVFRPGGFSDFAGPSRPAEPAPEPQRPAPRNDDDGGGFRGGGFGGGGFRDFA
jgi:hypothetical protein